ncbi:MAG: dihydroorotate dehydrogenase-like protein [Spirochaetes bacterium]|nr:dihydroorotate dehydrogenase-like protein [Spirochaetota bacterium]
MSDLKTTYMGLELKNPIMAGSSGFTSTVDKVKELEDNGIGGVVLKSIFEEQIMLEADSIIKSGDSVNADIAADDYIKYYIQQNNLNNYLKLIEDLKKQVSIPVIASVACVSDKGWTDFTESIENAGADALELNTYILPFESKIKSKEIEKKYFDIVYSAKKHISIPLAVKLPYYFTNLSRMIIELSKTGIDGLVLFNRFLKFDIDIESIKIQPGGIFSAPEEISVPLRWISLLSDDVKCDLAASIGIHDGYDAIKTILTGATCVEIASTIYKNGPSYIGKMIDQMEDWMKRHSFKSINNFKGKMNQANVKDPQQLERAQFMKYFSGHDELV